MNELPIGCAFCYPSPTCLKGFLPNDERELSKQEYLELCSKIKDTWWQNSFFLPVLQGQFVRAWEKEIDPSRKSLRCIVLKFNNL